MTQGKRRSSGTSYTLHIPFDPITWPKVRDLAAARQQTMEALGYLAIMKELDAAPAAPTPVEEERPIDVGRWSVFDRSRG